MNHPTPLWLLALWICTVTAFAGPFPPPAPTEPGSVWLAENGALIQGRRCGVEEAALPPEFMKLQRARALLGRFGLLLRTSASTALRIPVAVHVISSTKGEGNVPRGQVDEQIQVLNAAYQPHGFEFYLLSVDYTTNDRWFSGIDDGRMKAQLAVDPARTLNIYLNTPFNDIIGYSSLPWNYPEDNVNHGVVILYSTLPGGTAYPYDEGDSLVHEVGHYLGLFHPFQEGCGRPGDFVIDTPPQRTPAYDCPRLRDTCPDDPGGDPVYNFMNYTDDRCMREFTAGQADLMRNIVSWYRPSLGH